MEEEEICTLQEIVQNFCYPICLIFILLALLMSNKFLSVTGIIFALIPCITNLIPFFKGKIIKHYDDFVG